MEQPEALRSLDGLTTKQFKELTLNSRTLGRMSGGRTDRIRRVRVSCDSIACAERGIPIAE
jgi:hypothetical protein